MLRRDFGLLVILVAVYVLYQAVTPRLLASIEEWLLNTYGLDWALAGLLILWVLVRFGSWIHKTDAVVFTS